MKKIWIPIIVVIIIVVAIAAFYKPASKEAIKIGAILPLTGQIAVYGESIRAGVDLAVQEINNAKRVNNRKLEIVYEDNQGDTQMAVTAYQKLKQINGIDLYLSVPSPATLAIAPLAETAKSLIFDIGGGAPQISSAGDYIFRNNLLPATESKFLAEFLTEKMKFSHIALLVVNTDSGIGYRDEFIKNFEKLGGTITLTELYERGSSDFKSSLVKIKSEKNVDALLGISYVQEYAGILKQKKELGIDLPIFGVYTAESPQLIQVAGSVADGLIFTSAFDPDSNNEMLQEFQKKFNEKYGKKADYFAALGYDTVKIYIEAMRGCINITSSCLKDSLYKIKDFPGVTGKTSIDVNGDTNKPVIIKIVKNGQFVPYEE